MADLAEMYNIILGEKIDLAKKLAAVEHDLENEIAEGARLDEAHIIATEELRAKIAALEEANAKFSDVLGQINQVCVRTFPEMNGSPLADVVRHMEGQCNEWYNECQTARAQRDDAQKEVEVLEKHFERESMCHAGCGVIANAHHRHDGWHEPIVHMREVQEVSAAAGSDACRQPMV